MITLRSCSGGRGGEKGQEGEGGEMKGWNNLYWPDRMTLVQSALLTGGAVWTYWAAGWLDGTHGKSP